MESLALTVFIVFISLIAFGAASDPDPLQDFCVADYTRTLTVNGYPCKDPTSATVDDFVFHKLSDPLNTSNPSGFDFTPAVVSTFPGLNTLGLSIARIDVAKGGIVPPHTHARASELIYVVEGSLYAGFVTNDNKLFAKVINKGDVMVFPRGLIHFQYNVGNATGTAIVTLNSQDPGAQAVSAAMFATGIPSEVLQKAFFVRKNTIDILRASVTAGFS